MLVLASASPRRCELLSQAGFRFQVHAAHIDESRTANERPEDYVQRLALEKALAVLALKPQAMVLGADTTVVLRHGGADKIMNKPADAADAERMLRALSGRSHRVHTGIAVVTGSLRRQHVETTHVTFSEVTAAELGHYIASGDPLDKAGAYGIQGYAARWIPRIDGDYFNVVGLPIAATVRLLRQAGHEAGPD